MALQNAFEDLAVSAKQPALGTAGTPAADVISIQGRTGMTAVKAADDFTGGEVLADQTGAAGVLTFTFSAAVNLVVIESSGEGLVSRADVWGGTPAVSLGVPCRDAAPVYLPVIASALKVFAPVGVTVTCWGFRR